VITISKFYLKMHHSYGFFLSARTELLTTAMDAPDEPQNGLEQRSQRVLYAGRLDPEKGLPDLIQAFQGLPQPEAELLICGAGQSEDALKKLASADPRIKFLGRKTYAELKELYRTCRVVGLPSYAQEIFPLSIVEANAHGTPAIATNTGGSPEMVEDGKTGWLFSPGDVASLRGHLEALLTNDNQWQVFHTAGLKKYRSLQPERHLDRLAEIYQMAKMGS
jgi:glycosyltransferase involved in cell wall biosynthesis